MPPAPPLSRLPATDPGIPALKVAELLTSADDVISRIRLCFGVSRDDFDSAVHPLLYRYAAHVHLLPATADNYFSAPGGLLRLGLEVAFFSLQGTDAHIFSGRSTISARRQLEPRWRQATFIGGLCSELHRVLSHMVVTDAAGAQWPAFMMPLVDWLASHGADRYFVRWRPNAVEARGLGLFALPLVVPASTMQFLGQDNSVIVPHLLASVGGIPLHRDHNVLDSLVRRSLALVVDRHLQANADRHGTPQLGSHLERYLVEAMRRLVASDSSWTPNLQKSRAWFGPDGLFLLWPQSAADMQALLEADQLAGMPTTPKIILELLLAAGVFERQVDGSTTWSILPPESRSSLEAVKLSSPAILLAGLDTQPTPLPDRLVPEVQSRRATPPPAPSQSAPAPGTQFSLLDTVPSPAHALGEAMPVSPPATGNQPTVSQNPTTTLQPPPDLPLPPAAPTFKLIAPMRLNPAVRDALSTIIDTLNGRASSAAAAAIASGLFVPLQELERRGIQPALAARALSEAGMLVHPDRTQPPAVLHDFGGQPTVGLILFPTCVEGFDQEAFMPTAPTAQPASREQ